MAAYEHRHRPWIVLRDGQVLHKCCGQVFETDAMLADHARGEARCTHPAIIDQSPSYCAYCGANVE